MRLFDGTFILPPPPLRFNYCLGPPPIHQIISQPHHPQVIFSGDPPFKELDDFFSHSSLYFNPNNPQDPIWKKDTHRTAFFEDNHLQNYIFTKDNHPLDWKTTNPHQPHKNIVLCLQRPPYFSSGTAHSEKRFVNKLISITILRLCRSGQTVQTHIRLLLVYNVEGAVCTVCHSICIFWRHYSIFAQTCLSKNLK